MCRDGEREHHRELLPAQMKVGSGNGDALRDAEYRSAFVCVEVAHEYYVIGACLNLSHRAVHPALVDVRVSQNHDSCSFAYRKRLRKGELLEFFGLRIFDVAWAQQAFLRIRVNCVVRVDRIVVRGDLLDKYVVELVSRLAARHDDCRCEGVDCVERGLA